MALSPAQLVILKAAIDADPALVVLPRNDDTAFFIAAEFNKPAVPDYFVWKTNVTRSEIQQNGFAWVEVDNLTVGKARIWEWLFDDAATTINPSKANVRAGIGECWKGTAAKLAVQAAVLAHCKRSASVLESLFVTGTGTTASPALLGVEGDVSWYDLTSL